MSPCMGTVLTFGSIQGDDDTSWVCSKKTFRGSSPSAAWSANAIVQTPQSQIPWIFWTLTNSRSANSPSECKQAGDWWKGGVCHHICCHNSNFLSKRARCHSMVACNKWIWRALWKQSCSRSRLLCTGELGSQQTQARCMCSSVSHFPFGLVPRLSKIGGGEGLVHTLCTCT